MGNIYEKIYHIFDSTGKITQIEYALNAVKSCPQLISLCSDDTVVVINKRPPLPILQEEEIQFVYKITNQIYMAITGLHGDTIKIFKEAIEIATEEEYKLGCSLPVDIFARNFADKFQHYIQKSGLRLLAFAAHIFGFVDNKIQLYYTDLSAVEYECFGCASGEDDNKMTVFLEKHYKPNLNENELILIGLEALLQSIGKSAEHTEINVHVFNKNGIRKLDSKEIDKYLQDIAEN